MIYIFFRKLGVFTQVKTTYEQTFTEFDVSEMDMDLSTRLNSYCLLLGEDFPLVKLLKAACSQVKLAYSFFLGIYYFRE